jgi:four helix bundle protein
VWRKSSEKREGRREKVKTFRELIVWQKAIELVITVYKVTADFPTDEKFGLMSQTRRAAVSVPSNIAEGYGRHTPAEMCRFLDIAWGSLCELQTQLEICYRVGLIHEQDSQSILDQSDEVLRLLIGSKKYYEAKIK